MSYAGFRLKVPRPKYGMQNDGCGGSVSYLRVSLVFQ